MQKTDLKGVRVGRWTVLDNSEYIKGRTYWECRCDCGTLRLVNASSLKRKISLSCDCLKNERAAIRSRALMVKHGHSTHPLFRMWRTMLHRCYSPKNHKYYRYGARGITVCERWHDFALFILDMGEKPSPTHSIDRIDNDGNYEPSNCRWATPLQQRHNRPDYIHRVSLEEV